MSLFSILETRKPSTDANPDVVADPESRIPTHRAAICRSTTTMLSNTCSCLPHDDDDDQSLSYRSHAYSEITPRVFISSSTVDVTRHARRSLELSRRPADAVWSPPRPWSRLQAVTNCPWLSASDVHQMKYRQVTVDRTVNRTMRSGFAEKPRAAPVP